MDDKREPRKWPWSWSVDPPTDGGFEPAVQNTHIVAGRETKKSSKHAFQKTQINHLLCDPLGRHLIECALRRHFHGRCFLLPAEVSLTKRVTFWINGSLPRRGPRIRLCVDAIGSKTTLVKR